MAAIYTLGDSIVGSIVGSIEGSIVGLLVRSIVRSIVGSIIGSAIRTLGSEMSLFHFVPFSVVNNSMVVGSMIYMPFISFPVRL